jgi:hypothetical protein
MRSALGARFSPFRLARGASLSLSGVPCILLLPLRHNAYALSFSAVASLNPSTTESDCSCDRLVTASATVPAVGASAEASAGPDIPPRTVAHAEGAAKMIPTAENEGVTVNFRSPPAGGPIRAGR